MLYANFFVLPPSQRWLEPQPRNKWGKAFFTYANQDPYHYSLEMLKAVAHQAGFKLDLLSGFGHPTQVMGRFRQRRWLQVG